MSRSVYANSYSPNPNPNPNRNYRYVPIQTKRYDQPTERVIVNKPAVKMQKNYEREIELLKKSNLELREREEVYIQKLMKLEEGLQNQHREFIKLQQLYTQLFECYKKKQYQISQLEHKYRESSRSNHNDYSYQYSQPRGKQQLNSSKEAIISRQKTYTLKEADWLTKQKQWKLRQNQLMQLNQNLTDKLLVVNEKYEQYMLNQTNSRGSKDKPQPRMPNQESLINDINQWQAKFQSEKEFRLKYQYQNDFLKNRNQDLEKQREEFQKLLAYKQKQIGKLREEKIKIHRQTSEKLISRSPSRSRTTLRNTSPIHQNHDPKQQESRHEESSRLEEPPRNLQKYFSFSRQKRGGGMQQSLPAFPPQLQIDSLINEHRQ